MLTLPSRRLHRVAMALAVAGLSISVAVSPAAAGDGIWSENLLANPSFEAGKGLPNGWSQDVGARIGVGSSSELALDHAVKADGTRSLRIAVEDDDRVFCSLQSKAVQVKPGARLRLAGKMRTVDVEKFGRQYVNSNLFVQFRDRRGRVIRIGGYPVQGTEVLLGTRDWREVERLVRAPPRAATAVVGCFLSCSGTAWFDSVELQEQRIDWVRGESKRFRYFWETRQRPPQRALAGNDRNLARLEKLLGLEYPDKIAFYKYTSNERKGEVTGNRGNAHVEGAEIHSIFWSDRHEVVHVLLNEKLGPTSTALLGEGIAVYLSGAWQGKPVHSFARSLKADGRLLPIAELVDLRRFRALPELVTYGESGSFVGFLVERWGMKKFKALYVLPAAEDPVKALPRRFEAVYGTRLDEAEKEWLRFLSS